MKRLNFNIKDRKVLTLGLCLILVCVFTLTIAYAALNAVLTIQGSAQVTSANWDIHLANPKVTSGSATTAVPSITSGKTLMFNTTFNMPGDFYEFTVDVVNGGSIAAMIDKVTKTPELTADQLKYLKYEVSYANGESISTKQNIASGVAMPIKVRVEYRKDLTSSDLPTGTVQLTLSLVLDYIQSDGTGTTVNNNGEKLVSAIGDINDIGTIVSIGDQQFYTIGTEGDNVKLLSMYNLYVGNIVDEEWNVTPLANPTGKQSSLARGWVDGENEWYGITKFSQTSTTYEGSIVEGYVNAYKTIIEKDYGVPVEEARLISYDELTSKDIGCSADDYTCTTSEYTWIYLTSYWTQSQYHNDDSLWYVDSDGYIGDCDFIYNDWSGVRPVIIISKSNF